MTDLRADKGGDGHGAQTPRPARCPIGRELCRLGGFCGGWECHHCVATHAGAVLAGSKVQEGITPTSAGCRQDQIEVNVAALSRCLGPQWELHGRGGHWASTWASWGCCLRRSLWMCREGHILIHNLHECLPAKLFSNGVQCIFPALLSLQSIWIKSETVRWHR